MTVPVVTRSLTGPGARAPSARVALSSPACASDEPRQAPAIPGALDRSRRCRRAPRTLVRDYIRHVGGDPGWYRGRVPPHLFPQWGFPLAARALAGLPLSARARSMNAGCRIEIRAPLPAGEPLEVRARIESIDDDGGARSSSSGSSPGTPRVPEAIVAELRVFIPLASKAARAKRRARSRRPGPPCPPTRTRSRSCESRRTPGSTSPSSPATSTRSTGRALARASGLPHLHPPRLLDARARHRGAEPIAFRRRPTRARRQSTCASRGRSCCRRGSASTCERRGIWVGDAPGGGAYLEGRFETRERTIMSDFLLELSKNPTRARARQARWACPSRCRSRSSATAGRGQQRPLADARVAVGAAAGAELVARSPRPRRGGRRPVPRLPEALAAAFPAPGETFGRPAKKLDALAGGHQVDGARLRRDRRRDVDGAARALRVLPAARRRSSRARRASSSSARPAEGTTPEARRGAGGARRLRAQRGQGDRSRRARRRTSSSSSRGAEARLAAGAPVRPLGALGVRDGAAHRRDDARRGAIDEPALVRPLEKKIALVTGAARGIGEATARALAHEGAHVVCLDRPADDAADEPARARHRRHGARRRHGRRRRAGEDRRGAAGALGGVDVVVHNAGITRDKTLARMKPEQWDQRARHQPRRGHPDDRRASSRVLRDDGRIVCLSSIAGHRRQRGPDELRRVEGGHRRLRPRDGRAARRPRDHGERRRARLHRDAHDGGHPDRHPRGRAAA